MKRQPDETLDLIGRLLPEKAHRDAIHIAVYPAIAGTALSVGAKVLVREGKAFMALRRKSIGIVDPYLTKNVVPGDNFFIFLYPKKITSLRHVWSHPDLPDEIEREVKNPRRLEEEEALKWIDGFAATLGYTTEKLLDLAKGWLEHGEYEYDNSESYKGMRTQFDTFWEMYEKYTGREIDADKKTVFFTCSC